MRDTVLSTVELLTIPEAARIMRVSNITVRRHIAQGEIEAVRVGRQVRVRKDALDRFIKPVTFRRGPKGPSVPRGKRMSFDDSLWQLVGTATGAAPSDSAKKYEYLADATVSRRKT